MGQLVFQATLGGAVNLVGPNTASTFNLNVPAVASTIATLAAQTFAGTQTFTVDAVVNGLTVGRGAGAVSTNTAVGASALQANSTGASNTVTGYQAGYSMTGNWASAYGRQAMYSNTSGEFNTAVGGQALYTNSTGSNNVAIGHTALYSNTTASENTAVGYQAAYSNTTGTRLLALGVGALYSNTTGNVNIGLGDRALRLNTTGGNNTAIGSYAMEKNTTGAYNVAIGETALGNNTTASDNTAVGYQAGYTVTTSSGNVFVGKQAGLYSTGFNNTIVGVVAGGLSAMSGNDNVLVGQGSGYALTSGARNTFVGGGQYGVVQGSGSAVTTGSANTILGHYNGNQSGLDIRTASNYIVLSDGDGNPRAYCGATGQWNMGDGSASSGGALVLNGPNASNAGPIMFGQIASSTKYYVGAYSAIFGGGSNGSLSCQNVQGGGVYLSGAATSWSAASDERRKDIIEPITDAANKVSQLRAVIGKYKTDAEGVRRSFLIAQDVQAVLPEAVNVMEDKDGELLGVQYTDVIPLLVAAIKELKAEIDAYKATHP